MNTELYSLMYFSRSAMTDPDVDTTAEIGNILDAARINNSKLGITGALLMTSGCFAQVLEGPLDKVQLIFERIRTDPRHTEVTVLQCAPIARRSFSDWSMAFASPTGWLPIQAVVEGVLDHPACIDCSNLGKQLITVLQLLIAGTEITHAPSFATR
jgi:hypothetical protein